MNWKEIIRAYFNFTAKDRIALLLISCILGFVLLFPYLASQFQTNNSILLTDSALLARFNSADSNLMLEQPTNNNNHSDARFVEPVSANLFPFDPNILGADGWKKLGVRDKTILTIHNYRQKGGKFRKPEDLKKIYGFSPALYLRLEPYINIKSVADSNVFASRNQFNSGTIYKRPKPITKIEINQADSIDFIALPGIGKVLASRIIRFREKLGGFYSVDQISETFGLPDSVFKSIKPFLELNQSSLQLININSASLDELKQHPYIRYNIGKLIVNYRQQHGSFQSIDDLKNIVVITDDIFIRLRPYISI